MTTQKEEHLMEKLDDCLRFQCNFELKSNQQLCEISVNNPQAVKLEEWVCRIYFDQAKIPELYLQEGGLDIYMSSASIAKIIRKVEREACENQLTLIQSSIALMAETIKNSHYYKIDSDEPPTSFFLNQNQCKQNKSLDHLLNSSSILYEYSLWVIYQHYCSLSQSNKQACMLAEIIRQSNQPNPLSMSPEQQSLKDMTRGSESFLSNLNELSGMAEDPYRDQSNIYQSIKEEQLNIISVGYLIPLLIPSLKNKTKILADLFDKDTSEMLGLSLLSKYGKRNLFKNLENLDLGNIREQLNKIDKVIYGIVYKNKQNMRKYCCYLEQFEEALKKIKNKLSSISFHYKNQVNSNKAKKQDGLKINRKSLKNFRECMQNFQCDDFPQFTPLPETEKKEVDYFQIEDEESFQRARAELDREINKERHLFETDESQTAKCEKKVNEDKPNLNKVSGIDYFGSSSSILEKLNKMENSLFEISQQQTKKQKSLKDLADAESTFRQRNIFKGVQSFQFKTKTLSSSKQQMHYFSSEYTVINNEKRKTDIKDTSEKILPKQDAEIKELINKSLIARYFQKKIEEGDGSEFSFDLENLTYRRRQSEPEKKRNRKFYDYNITDQELLLQQKQRLARRQFEATLGRRRRQNQKNQIILQYDHEIDQQKINELLSLDKKLLLDDDFGMEDDDDDEEDEEKKKKNKKKKKRNRKKKKKNNTEAQEQQSDKKQLETEDLLPEVDIKLIKAQSVQEAARLKNQKISIQNYSRDSQLSCSAVETIKLLLTTKISKQNRGECFGIDKGTFDRWHRECENDKLMIESVSQTKSKNKRLKSNGRQI